MSRLTNLTRRDLAYVISGGAIATVLGECVRYGTAAQLDGATGMPGPFPGKVVGIEHSKCLLEGKVQKEPIQEMLRAGMMELTGESEIAAAWRRFVGPDDVVGLKINPNGNEGQISSPEFILEVINGVLSAGVKPENVIVYERYEFVLNSVRKWFPSWVTLESAAYNWHQYQQDIKGYDPQEYVDFPHVLSDQSLDNPVARRSHLAEFLTKRITKLINLPILKTHQTGGITIALKNMSHGLSNNVNRSHETPDRNLCGKFIPTVVAHPMIRKKAVLHIVDGTNGVFHGGPRGRKEHMWPHKTVYFASDPVAVDRVGWRVIDEKRVKEGLPILEKSPMDPPVFTFTEVQPQHVVLAGELGLGEWRDEKIEWVKRSLG